MVLIVVGGIAGGLAVAGNPIHRVNNAWHEFKQVGAPDPNAAGHLSAGFGGARYDYYRVALDVWKDASGRGHRRRQLLRGLHPARPGRRAADVAAQHRVRARWSRRAWSARHCCWRARRRLDRRRQRGSAREQLRAARSPQAGC